MFPIDVAGSIRLRNLTNPSRDIEPVAERIADMLDEAGASEVWLEQDAVRFKRGLLAGSVWSSSWNILVPFDSGSLRIETEDTSLRVHYRWSMLRLMLIVTALMVVVFALGIQHHIKRPIDRQAAINIAENGRQKQNRKKNLTGMIRVPLWLKRGLKDVAK